MKIKRYDPTNVNLIRHFVINWRNKQERIKMIQGNDYYKGLHDVRFNQRYAIGDGGQLEVVDNLPNNKIINNQYGKLVDQKTNYLLSKKITFDSKNDTYCEYLEDIFTSEFQRILRNVGQDSLNCGIGWLYVYYNEEGELCFKRFNPWEVIPFWIDDEHEILDFAIRVYPVQVFEENIEKEKYYVEVYHSGGIDTYDWNEGEPEVIDHTSYFIAKIGSKVQKLNWKKIPLIAFRCNRDETTLLDKVKTLQDALNNMLSNFANVMEENGDSAILVLKNYDGSDLGEFRYNLKTFRAVKVNTESGAEGGLDAVQIEVNSENFRAIIEMLKKAIIENGKGFDAKADNIKSGQANQMNILSMYSDIDLDANQMEVEFQAAFVHLLWFINAHLANKFGGNFEKEKPMIIFDRDIMMNENEIVNNCVQSVGVISNKTIMANHPWVKDVEKEQKQMEMEKEEELNEQMNNEILLNTINNVENNSNEKKEESGNK